MTIKTLQSSAAPNLCDVVHLLDFRKITFFYGLNNVTSNHVDKAGPKVWVPQTRSKFGYSLTIKN